MKSNENLASFNVLIFLTCSFKTLKFVPDLFSLFATQQTPVKATQFQHPDKSTERFWNATSWIFHHQPSPHRINNQDCFCSPQAKGGSTSGKTNQFIYNFSLTALMDTALTGKTLSL